MCLGAVVCVFGMKAVFLSKYGMAGVCVCVCVCNCLHDSGLFFFWYSCLLHLFLCFVGVFMSFMMQDINKRCQVCFFR